MTRSLPLVSVIITTRNEADNIVNCLKSIRKQNYPKEKIEIIVVDNNSQDNTKEQARQYTSKIYNQGPERSAQRNFGVLKSHGDYVLILDSDMILLPGVMGGCVQKIKSRRAVKGLVIPERSYGKGFWSQCKKLEKEFYNGVDWLEAARFFVKKTFQEFGGYDEENTGTEDYDLPQRIQEKYGKQSITRINEFINHNEGRLTLKKTCLKKFYYTQKLEKYKHKLANKDKFKKQASITKRYILFLKNPKKLLKNPFIGLGMMFMKTCEFTFGAFGYLKRAKDNKLIDIFIISHNTLLDGGIHYLRYFLERKNYKLAHLSHPLDDYKGRESYLVFKNKIIKKYGRRDIGMLNLIVDFFISIKTIFAYKFDVLLCANNFNTFTGIFAKYVLFKRIKKIIFYGADFSEERYKSSFLNRIYYMIEKIAVKKADIVISNTKRAESRRISLGLKKEKSLVIPNGVYLKKPIFPPKIINNQKFVYIGSVTREHGLLDLVEAMGSYIKLLVIIGEGKDLKKVTELCKKKNIDFNVFFKKEHEFVIDYLQKFNGFGLAPYNLTSKWVYYCSPVKVAEYIACGVPVLLSDITEIASLVKRKNLGITYGKIGRQSIISDIKAFDLTGYEYKAKEFYNSYNLDFLFKSINI